MGSLLGLLRVQLLLQQDAEFVLQGLQLGKVFLVLALVLDLGLDALENSYGGGVIVDPSRGLEGGLDNGRRGDEIVGEGVVQVALSNFMLEWDS